MIFMIHELMNTYDIIKSLFFFSIIAGKSSLTSNFSTKRMNDIRIKLLF